jgi:hypothetical protein
MWTRISLLYHLITHRARTEYRVQLQLLHGDKSKYPGTISPNWLKSTKRIRSNLLHTYICRPPRPMAEHNQTLYELSYRWITAHPTSSCDPRNRWPAHATLLYRMDCSGSPSISRSPTVNLTLINSLVGICR